MDEFLTSDKNDISDEKTSLDVDPKDCIRLLESSPEFSQLLALLSLDSDISNPCPVAIAYFAD